MDLKTLKLSEKQLEELEDNFKLFDKNKDGFIEKNELGTALKGLGLKLPDKELFSMIEEYQGEKTLKLDFNGFCKLFTRVQDYEKQDIDEYFNYFHKVLGVDSAGGISANEIKHVMTKLGIQLNDEEVEEMIADMDKDGSGIIDLESFRNFILSK